MVASRGYGLIVNRSDQCTEVQQTPRSSGLTNKYIKAVIRHPENPDIVYVGTANGFFMSYNDGHSWGTVNDGLLGAQTIYDLIIDHNNPGTVYAATPYGIFRLVDQ